MLITTIWPLFAAICLGAVLARRGIPSNDFWPAAEKLNYFVLFPALLISSLSRAPVSDPDLLRMGAAGATTILIAAGVMVLLRLWAPAPPERFGPTLQGVIRFNTYLGFAVITRMAPSDGATSAAVYLAIAVPLVNVLSIIALSGRARPRVLLMTVLRNPLVLGCVVGLTLASTGIGLPFGLQNFAALLAQGSLPLGLLCVGAALRMDGLRRDLPALLGVSALRLVAMPALAMAVALAFRLPADAALVLVAFSAIPTASTAYVLTRQLGGDGPYMAALITFQTLVAVVSLPLVLALWPQISP